MAKLTALSLSIAILGAIWAYLALGPFAAWLVIWAGFIAWGCFFHSGGDTAALSKTIAGNVYGIIVAWIALIIIVNVQVPALGAAWPALVVGVTVFFLVIVAAAGPLSVVPANVYGYAATVAYAAPQLSDATFGSKLFAPNFANPLVIVIVSMVLGALFGFASAKLAEALTRRELRTT